MAGAKGRGVTRRLYSLKLPPANAPSASGGCICITQYGSTVYIGIAMGCPAL